VIPQFKYIAFWAPYYNIKEEDIFSKIKEEQVETQRCKKMAEELL
jgi:hypothetical protein